MKVIISLTTIPSRLHDNNELGIKDCIQSLLNQSYENYEIHLNIPEVNKKTGEKYVIPDWLNSIEGKLTIFRTEDYGSITKIVPTLLRENDPDSIIIVCDDDLVYHEDMVSEQVLNQSKFTFDAAVGYDGMSLKSPIYGDVRDYYFTSNKKNGEVKVLQGYKTVSYRRKYFDEDFFNKFIDKSWADDIILSAYMASKGILKMVTYHRDDPDFENLKEWQERGGVQTFPVLRHTHHEQQEGCNLFRTEGINQDNPWLWNFIDA